MALPCQILQLSGFRLDRHNGLPELYLCCGTEDFLIEPNRAMHRFLEEQEVPHVYLEGPGIHDMVFWSAYIAKAIRWMFGDPED